MLVRLVGWSMNAAMTDVAKREDGASLHGGADEHSLMLYLKPEFVAPGYLSAPVVTGRSIDESFAVAKNNDWPGYLGSPRVATRALGETIWKAFAAAASEQTLAILQGADLSKIQRYVDWLEANPIYQRQWIAPSTARDAVLGAKQRDWLSRRPR